MYRYLILIWNPGDTQAQAVARSLAERLLIVAGDWSSVLAAPGVAAFHGQLGPGSSQTLVLADDAGAVFGRIFHRDMDDSSTPSQVRFDAAETVRTVKSGGRRLIERYWGRYVGLIHDRVQAEIRVVRDPSGGMPCLRTRHHGVELVFSDIEDCISLGVTGFTVDWSFIRRFVAYPGLQSSQTGLNEVSEVQPGECVCFGGAVIERSLEWDPIAIAAGDPIQDPVEAAEALRRVTRACLNAWASCYSHILHSLSGGLDSSIVLSCLASAPTRPHVTCLHFYGSGPGEDERHYARLMADRACVELVEHRLDAREARLGEIQRLKRSARPWFYFYELDHGRFELELARERAVSGLFSGSGGDGVFFQAGADLAVSDYLLSHGVGADLFKVAVDAAWISRSSVWPLLLTALHNRFLRPRWHPLKLAPPSGPTVVSPDVLRAARKDEALIHPWLAGKSLRGVPPGTLWHVLSVGAAPAFYSSFESGPYPERTLPLMSTPLIELCLRTPTYVLIRNGRDRATARRAFAGDLPAEILRRRNKGRIDQHVRNVLDCNIELVRDRLLGGRLVSNGLLDRNALERYLARERSPADAPCAQILHEHFCTEAWLECWERRTDRLSGARPAGEQTI